MSVRDSTTRRHNAPAACHPPSRSPPTSPPWRRELAAAGGFALDLEFVSEARYVPELALVQVAWGDAATRRWRRSTRWRPIRGRSSSWSATRRAQLLHAGHGDLALLGHLFGARGANVLDTQIAASFLGLGEQVGYAPLVERLLGVKLDKTSQFTQWARRPLTPEQLAYALDDVRYLPRLWRRARRAGSPTAAGWPGSRRRPGAWPRPRPAACRRKRPSAASSGWSTLNPRQLGALRALAAWREREALAATSRRPGSSRRGRSWRSPAGRRKSQAALEEVRGVSEGTARRHGQDILAALRRGWEEPLEAEREPFLPPVAQSWAAMLSALIQARSREGDVAARFVASQRRRRDARRLVVVGNRDHEPDLPLLQGWRRELAGQAALDWLAGRAALVADEERPPACASRRAARPIRRERLAPYSSGSSPSRSATARSSAARSAGASASRRAASRAVRRARPRSIKRRPAAVARSRTTRPSAGSGSRATRPSASSAATSRLIVGAVTCSAAASSPSVRAPPKASTESAEARAGETPSAASSCRSRRSRWIAAACRRSASSWLSSPAAALDFFRLTA